MKNILLSMFLLCINLFAVDTQKVGANYSLGFEIGERTDELLWNIGNADFISNGITYHPDILSELQWNDISSYYSKIELLGEEGRYRLKINYLKSMDSKSGTNQDSDYYFSGRTGEFSRSNNKTEGSYFEDYSISIGDNYKLGKTSDLTFWLGYEVNNQYLNINNGTQTIGGPLDLTGLNSSYDTQWKGFFAKLDYGYKFSKFNINANIEYHYMEYLAEANWNLRDDLEHPVSFKHSADDANGIGYGLDMSYILNDSTKLFINYNKKEYKIKNGKAINYNSNGTTGSAYLNEVIYDSEKVSLGIVYKF